MKLVSYGHRGEERAGLLVEDCVVDLARVSDGTLPADLMRLVVEDRLDEAGALHRDVLARLAARGTDAFPRGVVFPRAEVRLGPPLARPPKIIAVGLNYRDHALEQKKEPPERPLLFCKASTSVIGSEDRVEIEADMVKVDYELELGVLVGRRARRVPRGEAMRHVAGYLMLLDMSDREAQYGDRQWFRGKSHDTFAPLGPWIAWAPSVPDPHALAMRLAVNGETRQSSSTGEMIFRVDDLIEYISRTITLEPGDVIATGTPAGVGVFRDPPVFLRAGDRIRAAIDSLGSMEIEVVLRGQDQRT